MEHICIGKQYEYLCNQCEIVRLSELATRWYLADGTYETLTEDEVIRRRKEAAVILVTLATERDTYKEAYETMQVLKEGMSEASASLRSDNAALAARVKELEERRAETVAYCDQLFTEKGRLQSRLSALEKVAKYVKHIGYCNKVQRPYDHGGIFGECNCGLDAALKAVEGREG